MTPPGGSVFPAPRPSWNAENFTFSQPRTAHRPSRRSSHSEIAHFQPWSRFQARDFQTRLSHAYR